MASAAFALLLVLMLIPATHCDVNECTDGTHTCDTNAACVNTDGSYTCTCNDGYSGNGQMGNCAVCPSNRYGSQCMSHCTCVTSATCNNVDGQCTCTEPFTGATCDRSALAILSFMPQSGSSPFDDTADTDNVILECRVNLDESEQNLVKFQYPGGLEYTSTYAGDGVFRHIVSDVHPSSSGTYTCRAETTIPPNNAVVSAEKAYTLTVDDVDECDTDTDDCNTNAACQNTVGGFHCTCNDGFSGNGVDCVDINECDRNEHDCDSNAICTNTVGSFDCTCIDGYSGSGRTGDCTECVQGSYGFNCENTCTCVAPVPGMNDVMCDHVDGTCTCHEEFPGKTCDKSRVTIGLMTDPDPVLDTAGVDDVVWKCSINLHSRDISGGVTLTNPENNVNAMTRSAEGLYEYTLTDAQQYDSGIYTCTATPNGMAAVMATFDLDVLVVGRIISVSEPTEGRLTETVQISCAVYATSRATITWFRGAADSTPLTDSSKYTISMSGPVELQQIRHLEVRDLVREDNGTYVCKAENTLNDDVDTKRVYIIVIEKPEIVGIDLTALSSEELLAMWTITFDGNLGPPECHVQHKQMGGDWMVSVGSPVTGVSFTVTNLLPFTEYEVRVTCSNKVGPSNEIMLGPQRTLQSNPTEPLNVQATDIQADSFSVTWNEPAMKNGLIDRYVVTVTTEGGGLILQNTEWTRSSLVTNLEPFTYYTVVVVAISVEQGRDLVSAPSSQHTIQTAEAAPSPPLNVRSVDHQDACAVTWDKPENENGILRRYKVYYTVYPRSNPEASRQFEGRHLVEVDAGEPRNYSLPKSQLPAFSEIEFTVSAVTVSESAESEVGSGSCVTTSEVPTEVPAPVIPDISERNANTESSFKLTLPPVNQRNGRISCLEVTVVQLEEDDVIEERDPDVLYFPELLRTYEEAQSVTRLPYVALVLTGDEVREAQDVEVGTGGASECTSDRQHTGTNGQLNPNTKYTVFLRAYIVLEDGTGHYVTSPLSQPIWTDDKAAGDNTVVIAVVIVAVVILGILALVVYLVVHRRRHDNTTSPKTSETRPTVSRVVTQTDEEGYELTNVSTDNEVAIYEKIGLPGWAQRWQIPWENVALDDTVLGRGNFGVVRSGSVTIDGGHRTKAALKILKGHVSETDREDFMEEFHTMTTIGYHPNVVSLLGACQHDDTLYVALEFLPNGDLRTYLRGARSPSDEGALSSQQLIQFARDVAKGMEHLALSGVIHRDLAARNVLLGADLVAKVSDFGLSRGEDVYVQTSTRRVPARWLAIESLTRRTYTTQSDVWSFGILLWEIASIGGTPYPSIKTVSLVARLLEGYRMSKPSNCDDEIYALMMRCWKVEPDERPSFHELVTILTEMSTEMAHTYMSIDPGHYENYCVIRPELDDN